MKNIHILILIPFSILALILNACNSTPQLQEEEHHEEAANRVELTQAQYQQASIKIGKAERRNMSIPLKVNGLIDVPPQGNVSISMPYGGFITNLDLLPGSDVKKGQVLVTLENPEFIGFQQEYLEGLANRLYLKQEFLRQEKLHADSVTSTREFEKAKSEHLVNEAKIQSMEARLKMIGFNIGEVQKGNIRSSVSITSKVHGSIREVLTNVGSYVQPQDVIMSITDREDLHVELTVYESDIPKVKTGQVIRFRTENKSDWREAEVFLVGKDVREDRSVTVHGHLKSHDDDLLPGMYVSAMIETASISAWTLEESSIVRFGGKHYVFISKGEEMENGAKIHVFEMLEVTLGNKTDHYLEVISIGKDRSLSELTLVTKGAFTLLGKAKNSEDEGGHSH
jgi:membrane fusion protein, heavy metal efflux system